MTDEAPALPPLDQLSDRDLLVMTYTNVSNHSTAIRDHEGRIRATEVDIQALKLRPHLTAKQLWGGILGFLASGSGIAALANLIAHH